MTVTKLIAIGAVVAIIAVAGLYFTGMWDPKNPTQIDTSKLTDENALEDPYSEGARQFKLHNWSDALSAYTKALEEKPNDGRSPAAMYYQAYCHEELGNKAEAIAGYKAFLKKYPKHANAQKARGRLSKKFGVTAQ